MKADAKTESAAEPEGESPPTGWSNHDGPTDIPPALTGSWRRSSRRPQPMTDGFKFPVPARRRCA
jgi:hypothetical protein